MTTTGTRRLSTAVLGVLLLVVSVLVGCSSDDGDSAGPNRAREATTSSGPRSATTTTGPTGSPSGSGGSSGAAAEEITGSSGDALYANLPAEATGPPGRLVRYQKLPGVELAGATAYRILYVSRSVQDDPIFVSGVAVVPPGDAPKGGRRLLTLTHGTTGIADQCAPSRNPGGTELALTGPFIRAGYLVAQTDYEGLGTPGRHPYLVGESEGRSAVDAIRAAKQLPDAHGGDQLGIIGYSQGGHGALWANQVASSAYGKGLDVRATVAGAPATETDIIFRAAPGMPIRGLFMMMVAGYHAAYPDADLEGILTPKGIKQLGAVDETCVGGAMGSFTDGDLIKPIDQWSPIWMRLAEENNPGQVKTPDPILIVHSKQDNLVPATLSTILLGRLCRLGQTVSRVELDKGQDHGAAAPDAYRLGFRFIQDRSAGKPAASTCPAGR